MQQITSDYTDLDIITFVMLSVLNSIGYRTINPNIIQVPNSHLFQHTAKVIHYILIALYI